ncbi:MAG: phosphonoacetaldehyde reductase [Planctomycetota bacterium]|jgi:alcohol dehydrogenase class IV|nr:phosphonoacetaldehyde reductase [Planctomycetota bacterium]
MRDYVGFGALSEALQALAAGGYATVLAVASESGWKRFNAAEKRQFFAERDTRLFSGFSINPDIREIMAGAGVLKEFKPDLIVALGGGSAMDVAKMMKALAFTREPFTPEQPEGLKPSGDGPPLAAIATTAGSGAEATQYGVFYKGEEKQSLAHPSLRPEMAIVDPEMTYSLPPAQTAATGFDGLSQSVEAFWCSNTTPEARELASASIKYILPNIEAAVRAPEPGNRYHMAQGAYLSGKAINITRTTMPHALCYHLTKKYGLPHGHAVAITLPYFFLINMDPSLPVNSPLGPERHRRNMKNLFAVMGRETAEDCFSFWRDRLRACGLAATLPEIGMKTADQVSAMVASMNLARQKNNPVHIEADYLVNFIMERL